MAKSFFILSVLFLAIGQPLDAKLRISTTRVIPTADLLSSQQFSLGANLNLFKYRDDPASTDIKFWYWPVFSLDGGILNRAEAGLYYADGPGFRFKTLLVNEGMFFRHMPSVALGARDIMKSAECFYFGFRNPDTLNAMANQAYFVLSKNVEPLSLRVHAGLASNYRLESERYTPFGGVEMYLGGSSYFTYEMFQRFGSLHMLFTINFKIRNKFNFGFGLTEIPKVFRQNGGMGFFIQADSNTSGYNAPGFNFNFAWIGTLSGSTEGLTGLDDDIKGIKASINELKTRTREVEGKVELSDRHLRELDEDLALYTSRASARAKMDYKVTIDEKLAIIGRLLENKDGYEPEEIAQQMKKIVEFKDLAIPKLSDVVRNPKTDPRLTALCIQMMGQIGDKHSRQVLVRLMDYREANIKIEAIIALGKLHDKEVIDDLRRALSDTDEAVVLAAREVIAKLSSDSTYLTVKPRESGASADTLPALAPAPIDSTASSPAPDGTPVESTPQPVNPPKAAIPLPAPAKK